MKSHLPKTIKSFAASLLANRRHTRHSYSQCGEDLILSFAFDFLGVEQPTYLDIGAHHPEYLSNTALFHKRGCRGVNVEPDRALFARLSKVRSRDVNLNIGISDHEGVSDFYLMSAPELNTFSREEAEKLDGAGGLQIVAVEQLKVEPINKVLDAYFKKRPDLLSIDVEGLDMRILKSLNFDKHAPLAICAETLSYSTDGTGTKNTELIEFVSSKGYFVYADTYINTIFFHIERFNQMRLR